MPIESILYFADLISNIGGSFFVISCILGIIILIYVGLQIVDESDDEKVGLRRLKLIKKLLIYFSLTAFICAIFPSEKTVYLMIGAHYLKKTDIPSKVEKIINKKLDDYLTIEDK